MAAKFLESVNLTRELLVVVRTELLLRISFEIGKATERNIGRIQEYEITPPWVMPEHRSVVLAYYRCRRKSFARSSEEMLIAKPRILVAAIRHVKLSTLINSVKSVKARSIQIMQARSSFGGVKR